MLGWNVPFERELIEQSSLFDLRMPHHDSLSCFSQRLNQRMSGVATADFFNTIGQQRTHAPQQIATLFDQLVGNGEQLRIQFEIKRLGSLEVDHELKLAGLDHWQFGWLRALENPPGVNAGLSV